MIVATAGHVDHGKTTLVKALTGVDADRLPEEKQRGLTIDLGFAYSGNLGFVDVPGHERFVHNMLAGAAGIDLALLVVAADDGPMPQTREHLAILRLLGVPYTVVALTKIDRVAPARLAEVSREVEALLPGAPQFPLCALRGEGIEALRAFLSGRAQLCRGRSAEGNFRLCVDRAFTLSGAGLVVTGTALAGAVAVGDVVRSVICRTRARVRALRAHNAPVARGRAGQRLALNLAGLDGKVAIRRGDWIVSGAAPGAVARFDARLECLDEPIRHGMPVHLHIGAADVLARIYMLEGKEISRDDAKFVRIVLEDPCAGVGAVHGDRFVVRDASARRTLGGGAVVDIFPPSRGRARAQRLEALAALAIEDDGKALDALLECSPAGIDMEKFAAGRNLPHASGWRFAPRHWKALREHALARLCAWHAAAPDSSSLSPDRLLEDVRIPRPAAAQLVDELVREGLVARESRGLRLAGHRVGLAAPDAALWNRISPLLERGGLRPPTITELAFACGTVPKRLEALLARLAHEGEVVQVSRNRYFLPSAVKRMEGVVLEMQSVTAAAFRDRIGIGRGLAIEVLEYFDRIRLTRRVGDAHVLRSPSGTVSCKAVPAHEREAGN